MMKKLTSRLQNLCIVSTLLFVIGSSAQAESEESPCTYATYDACTSITDTETCNNSWSYIKTYNKTGEEKIVRCQWKQGVCINTPRSAIICSAP